jgi:predicted TIM-barrel fold metal-dependent hydrolase
MIIDVNAFIGKWPHWPIHASSGSEVVEALREWKIDRAVICSTRSLFVDCEDGNREAETAQAAHPGEFETFACLAPAEQHDFAAYSRRGFRGVRIYPQYHSYHPLYVPFVDALCEDAAARGWPVLLPHRAIMNWSVPLLDLAWMAALVERHPRVVWILAGINYLYEYQMAEMLLRRYPTVHVETSCIMGFDAVAKLARSFGADRVLFGSGAPLQNGGAGVAKILHAKITDTEREAIFEGNARRLLNLK